MKKDNLKKNNLKRQQKVMSSFNYPRSVVFIPSQLLEEIPETQSPWYETPEEIEKKLKWGEEKARLLQWVKKQIERKLTTRERKYIEYYYFQGETLEIISKKFHTHPANVHRTIRRGIKKLIQLTHNENLRFNAVRMKRKKSSIKTE